MRLDNFDAGNNATITTVDQLHEVLSSDRPAFPELDALCNRLSDFRQARQTQQIMEETWQFMTTDLTVVPNITYTDPERIRSRGDSNAWYHQYFLKRAQLNATALRWLFGDPESKPKMKHYVQERLWAICEETSWRAPGHSHTELDILAAETGFALAELLYLFKACNIPLDPEIRERVVFEIESRVLETYVKYGRSQWWYNASHDWNSVINGCVAATFILLCENNPLRAAYGVQMAVDSLKVYFEKAFEEDGASMDGIGVWEYTLTYPVILSELLFSKSGGELNLLGMDRLRTIATYPGKMVLSAAQFAPFADHKTDKFIFSPGFLTRLSIRTGDPTLMNIIGPRTPTSQGADHASKFPRLLRDLLWWDGTTSNVCCIEDTLLPAAEIVRLVTTLPGHTSQTVVIIKAGHNGEIHNHNDVGSFVLHVDGESLLTDPGASVHSVKHRSDSRRLETNIFTNSFGHSVPRIGGRLQATGHMFHGELVLFERHENCKFVEIEFSQAYDTQERLADARRRIELPLANRNNTDENTGSIHLSDAFEFDGEPMEVEEAFVTWHECEIRGLSAVVHGRRYDLVMSVQRPVGVGFKITNLVDESFVNRNKKILKRITAVLPLGEVVEVDIKMEVIKRTR